MQGITIILANLATLVLEAFFPFIHFGSAVSEDAFYADLAQPSEVAESFFFFIAILPGDALVAYRLWIIRRRNMKVVIFPMFALVGLFSTSHLTAILTAYSDNYDDERAVKTDGNVDSLEGRDMKGK
ncbi:hypothetical protein K438DRAFT_1768015 [Mycena galopus ATCC 62051]|nr:hypothetical protein K438DRAFT_1768015 [Mycena galopus ATCC 62051]